MTALAILPELAPVYIGMAGVTGTYGRTEITAAMALRAGSRLMGASQRKSGAAMVKIDIFL